VSPGELGFTADGGWAEYVRVETPRLHRVPDSLPSNEAVLAEPFAIPLGALLDSKEPISGRRVLVVGDGLAAFAFASAAFALGAGHVDVSLRHQERTSLFETINEAIHVLTGDLVEPGLADISVDTVGRSASIRTALSGTRNRGLTICYGLSEAVVQDFPLSEVILRNLRISGHTNPRQVWPTLVGLLEDRSLRTEGLVDRIVTLDDVPDVVTNWTRSFKTVIEFRGVSR
jgi:threonine dehydrogenase-like Zn-dependent dehydrogenase